MRRRSRRREGVGGEEGMRSRFIISMQHHIYIYVRTRIDTDTETETETDTDTDTDTEDR